MALMVASRQLPSNGLSQTLLSLLNLVMGCGSLVEILPTRYLALARVHQWLIQSDGRWPKYPATYSLSLLFCLYVSEIDPRWPTNQINARRVTRGLAAIG